VTWWTRRDVQQPELTDSGEDDEEDLELAGEYGALEVEEVKESKFQYLYTH